MRRLHFRVRLLLAHAGSTEYKSMVWLRHCTQTTRNTFSLSIGICQWQHCM